MGVQIIHLCNCTCYCLSGLESQVMWLGRCWHGEPADENRKTDASLRTVKRHRVVCLGPNERQHIFLIFLLVTFPFWMGEKRIKRERNVKTKSMLQFSSSSHDGPGQLVFLCSAFAQEIRAVTSGSLTQINLLCLFVLEPYFYSLTDAKLRDAADCAGAAEARWSEQ